MVGEVATFSTDLSVLTLTPSSDLRGFNSVYTLEISGVENVSLFPIPMTTAVTSRFTTVLLSQHHRYYVSDTYHGTVVRLDASGTGAVSAESPLAAPRQAWRFADPGNGTYEILNAGAAGTDLLDGGTPTGVATMRSGSAPSRIWRIDLYGFDVNLLWLPQTLGESRVLGRMLPSTMRMMDRPDPAQLYQHARTFERVTDQPGY